MVTTSPPTFGALLRHRLAAALTQEALAERAGVSTRGIPGFGADRAAPRAETVRLLAEALGLGDAARTALIAAVHPELAAPAAPLWRRSRRRRTSQRRPRRLSGASGRWRRCARCCAGRTCAS